MSPRPRGASLVEVLWAVMLFGLISLVALYSLLQVSQLWRRNSAQDLALRQLQRAERQLQRDLANSSRAQDHSLWGPISAGSPGLKTSDALALLIPDPDQAGLDLDDQGRPRAEVLVTYYLAIPSGGAPAAASTLGGDAAGYEDHSPYKWLIRRETESASLPADWLSSGVIEVPNQLWLQTDRRVVAQNLLQLRVLQGPPTWEVQMSAVAVEDAQRSQGFGSSPLSSSRYTLIQRISRLARND